MKRFRSCAVLSSFIFFMCPIFELMNAFIFTKRENSSILCALPQVWLMYKTHHNEGKITLDGNLCSVHARLLVSGIAGGISPFLSPWDKRTGTARCELCTDSNFGHSDTRLPPLLAIKEQG